MVLHNLYYGHFLPLVLLSNMNVFLESFVSVYLWSVSILLPVSLFCLLYSKKLPKQIISNFTMTVFIKILGVQEAWSLGVIWLHVKSVIFLWIFVNKHSVNISSNGNTQLIFIVNLSQQLGKSGCSRPILQFKITGKYRRYQHQFFTVVCCNIRVYASCVSSRI